MDDEHGGEGAVAFRHEDVELEFFPVDLFVDDVLGAVESVLTGIHIGTKAKQQK